MAREFPDHPAERSNRKLRIGLSGPSGSGKTLSALLLARGIQRVQGGDIFCIDTEARSSEEYADLFPPPWFRAVPFRAPFSPLDYLECIEQQVRKGARHIVVDSMSHEHEGPGGVLEWHEAECDRLMKAWNTSSRDAVNMGAWTKPKQARVRLLNTIQQLEINVIFCFRAKDSVHIPKKGDPDREIRSKGWDPIAGDEFYYEMRLRALLYPGCGGVPEWEPKNAFEKRFVRLPNYFEKHFLSKKGKPLDEADGEFMARWAAGGEAKPALPQGEPAAEMTPLERVLVVISEIDREDGLKNLAAREREGDWTPEQKTQIKDAIDARQKALLAAHQAKGTK